MNNNDNNDNNDKKGSGRSVPGLVRAVPLRADAADCGAVKHPGSVSCSAQLWPRRSQKYDFGAVSQDAPPGRCKEHARLSGRIVYLNTSFYSPVFDT